MTIPQKHFDVIIVGGGSAGCVLAARLSENARRDVLLIEAGRNIAEGQVPREVLSPYAGLAYFDPGLTYADLRVRFGGSAANELIARPLAPYSQGRALGGGSVVNGMGANRGAPSDYDEWEAMGAKGWNWNNVAPYFRKLERDLEIVDHHHGQDGPLPIRRIPPEWRSRFVRAAIDALARRGHVEKADQNGEWEDGVFAQKVNLDEAFRRVPTSLGWLTPAVRARPNLTIITDASVSRLLFDGRKATGVALDLGTTQVPIKSGEVIVSAGALQTPALLMRSGIGPAGHLKDRGIETVHHLAGVGQNLMEHPYAGISFFLPRGSRMASDDHHHIPAVWRFSSGLPGCPAGDMHLGMMGRSAWHAIGKRLGALAFWVNKSFSRGFVELGDNIDAPPVVDMRLLSDDRDRTRLRDAFHLAAGLAADISATGVAGLPQPARMSDRARKYGANTARNRILTGAGGLLADMSGPFGAAVMRRLTHDGPGIADLLSDPSALDQYLEQSVIGVWHASGTCRMGRTTDPMAVTDPEGRVLGMSGLRICDASLFPTIPCANLNVPVIMCAEKISSTVLEQKD